MFQMKVQEKIFTNSKEKVVKVEEIKEKDKEIDM